MRSYTDRSGRQFRDIGLGFVPVSQPSSSCGCGPAPLGAVISSSVFAAAPSAFRLTAQPTFQLQPLAPPPPRGPIITPLPSTTNVKCSYRNTHGHVDTVIKPCTLPAGVAPGSSDGVAAGVACCGSMTFERFATPPTDNIPWTI